MFAFGKQSLSKLKGVHPHLVAIIVVALKRSGVDFTVDYGVRTAEEQYALYQHGRTKPGDIVTQRDGYKVKSNHQAKDDGYGYAVDIYPYIQGKVDYANKYGKLSSIAKTVKNVAADLGFTVVWGGDWTVKEDGVYDPPHFELR